jgi:hypothetical protein
MGKRNLQSLLISRHNLILSTSYILPTSNNTITINSTRPLREPVLRAVVKLGRARAFMRGH